MQNESIRIDSHNESNRIANWNASEFPTVDDPLRTDEDSKLMRDENHHIIPCPLCPLRVGFVSQFGIDYMHNAYGMFVGDAQVIIVLEGPHGSTECEIAKEFCA